MKTIGETLKETRINKKISLSHLENLTKIKKEFILRIEKNDWDNLPEFPVVSGFVRNLASALEISPSNAAAILRRDYPPKKLTINPKPDVDSKFTWSPKLTFFIGVAAIVLIVLGYLGIEYLQFIKPPSLTIKSPSENATVLSRNVKVEGETETDAKLTINNQPFIVDQDGNFIGEIEITKDTNEIKFVATSRSGKETIVSRNINTDFD